MTPMQLMAYQYPVARADQLSTSIYFKADKRRNVSIGLTLNR